MWSLNQKAFPKNRKSKLSLLVWISLGTSLFAQEEASVRAQSEAPCDFGYLPEEIPLMAEFTSDVTDEMTSSPELRSVFEGILPNFKMVFQREQPYIMKKSTPIRF